MKKEKFLHNRELPHRRGHGRESLRTSEGSATTGAQKAEWREFSPEIAAAAEQHIPAEKRLTQPRGRVGAGYSGSGFKGWTPGRGPGLAAVTIVSKGWYDTAGGVQEKARASQRGTCITAVTL